MKQKKNKKAKSNVNIESAREISPDLSAGSSSRSNESSRNRSSNSKGK